MSRPSILIVIVKYQIAKGGLNRVNTFPKLFVTCGGGGGEKGEDDWKGELLILREEAGFGDETVRRRKRMKEGDKELEKKREKVGWVRTILFHLSVILLLVTVLWDPTDSRVAVRVRSRYQRCVNNSFMYTYTYLYVCMHAYIKSYECKYIRNYRFIYLDR